MTTVKTPYIKTTGLIDFDDYPDDDAEDDDNDDDDDSFFVVFFSVRLLSVLRDHSVFSSPPQRPMDDDSKETLH